MAQVKKTNDSNLYNEKGWIVVKTKQQKDSLYDALCRNFRLTGMSKAAHPEHGPCFYVEPRFNRHHKTVQERRTDKITVPGFGEHQFRAYGIVYGLKHGFIPLKSTGWELSHPCLTKCITPHQNPEPKDQNQGRCL